MRPRLQVVPDDQPAQGELVCPRCQPLEQENDALKTALRTLQAQLDEQAAEIAGLQLQLRRAGQAEVALRNQLKKATEEDEDGDDEIRTILKYWKRKLGHPNAQIKKTGKRWAVVKAARKHWSDSEILEAIDGLALLPYVGASGRKATGTDAERHDELHIPLKDETTMDRFCGYARRAKASAAAETDAMFRTYFQVEAAFTHWQSLVLGAVCRREWLLAPEDVRERLSEEWRLFVEESGWGACEPSFVGLPVKGEMKEAA